MSEWINVKKELPKKNNWNVYAVVTSEDNFHKIQICWFSGTKKTWHMQNDTVGRIPINVLYWKDIDCNFEQCDQSKDKE